MTAPDDRTIDWPGRLRAAGLRVTRPRLAVLQVLTQLGGPRSHGEVVEALAKAGWDRATLFRNLNDLAAAGLLRRFDVGDHVWRFELAASQSAEHGHAHFVCNDCGSVQCVDGVELRADEASRPLLSAATDIQIRGTCPDCL